MPNVTTNHAITYTNGTRLGDRFRSVPSSASFCAKMADVNSLVAKGFRDYRVVLVKKRASGTHIFGRTRPDR